MPRRVVEIPRPSWRIRIVYIVLLGSINLAISYALITILDPHLLPAAIHGRNSYILGLQVLMCFFMGEVASLDHHASYSKLLRLLSVLLVSVSGPGVLACMVVLILESRASAETIAHALLLAGSLIDIFFSVTGLTAAWRIKRFGVVVHVFAPRHASPKPPLQPETPERTVGVRMNGQLIDIRPLFMGSLLGVSTTIGALVLLIAHLGHPIGAWTSWAAGCAIAGFFFPLVTLLLPLRLR